MSRGTLQAQGHLIFAVSVAFAATAATPASKPSTPPGVPKSVAAFRRSDGGAFFRSHFSASFLAAAKGSQVVPPSPRGHGTVLVGHGILIKLAAAADAASWTRQRIDANRALHCGVFVANNAIYSRSVRLNPRSWPGEHHPQTSQIDAARTHRCRNCSRKSHK